MNLRKVGLNKQVIKVHKQANKFHHIESINTLDNVVDIMTVLASWQYLAGLHLHSAKATSIVR